MRRQCAAWTELTETRTKANRRPIVGGWCNFATTTSAVWPGLTQSLSLQGCTGAAVDASINPHPPNAGDGGARTATSFVANSKRSEDARMSGKEVFIRSRRRALRA